MAKTGIEGGFIPHLKVVLYPRRVSNRCQIRMALLESHLPSRNGGVHNWESILASWQQLIEWLAKFGIFDDLFRLFEGRTPLFLLNLGE